MTKKQPHFPLKNLEIIIFFIHNTYDDDCGDKFCFFGIENDKAKERKVNMNIKKVSYFL